MTITMFITLLTIGSAVVSLLTEAIKKAYSNKGMEYSSNLIALVDAIVVGGGGTAVAYMLLGTPWTVNNIICLILMMVAVWIGAMIGFDKIKQLVEQIGAAQNEKK